MWSEILQWAAENKAILGTGVAAGLTSFTHAKSSKSPFTQKTLALLLPGFLNGPHVKEWAVLGARAVLDFWGDDAAHESVAVVAGPQGPSGPPGKDADEEKIIRGLALVLQRKGLVGTTGVNAEGDVVRPPAVAPPAQQPEMSAADRERAAAAAERAK